MDQYQIGSRIEISDPDEIWSSATVTHIRRLTSSALVTIRYDGWDTDWNEVLPTGSKRLATIYTHTARLACLVKLFKRRKPYGNKKNKKQPKEKYHEPSMLWPCVLNVRMAMEKRGEVHLGTEKNVFVEPYRPDLLPSYLKKEWKNGGMWLDASKVVTWHDFGDLNAKKVVTSSTTSGNKITSTSNGQQKEEVNEKEATKQIFFAYPNNFQMAYLTAERDTSVPGKVAEPLFEMGTLVKEKFMVKKSTMKNILMHSSTSSASWENKLVNLKALNKILSPNQLQASASEPGSGAAVAAVGKTGTKIKTEVKQSSNHANAQDNINVKTSANTNMNMNTHVEAQRKGSNKRKLDSLEPPDATNIQKSSRPRTTTLKHDQIQLPASTYATVSSGEGVNQDELAMAIENSLQTNAIESDLKLTRHQQAGVKPTRPYESGDAAIPTGIRIKDSIYPGYHITETTVKVKAKVNVNVNLNLNGGKEDAHVDVDGHAKRWIATVMERGNAVHLGKYSTQAEAKSVIDKHVENARKKAKEHSERMKMNMTMEGLELKVNSTSSNSQACCDDSSSLSMHTAQSRVASSDDSSEQYHNICSDSVRTCSYDDDDHSNVEQSATMNSRSSRTQRSSSSDKSSSHDDNIINTASPARARSRRNSEYKDEDIAAISVEKAVSIAYRDGNQIQDTGFSIHEWALVTINDNEKAKWRGKFLDLKRARAKRAEKNQSIHRATV